MGWAVGKKVRRKCQINTIAQIYRGSRANNRRKWVVLGHRVSESMTKLYSHSSPWEKARENTICSQHHEVAGTV